LLLRSVTLLAVVLLLSGCTLIGAGIGAAVPAHSYEDVTGLPGRPEVNDTVLVSSSHQRKTRGHYKGIEVRPCPDQAETGASCPRYAMVIETWTTRKLVPTEEITRVCVRREDGDHMARGAMIGAVIDFTLLAFGVYMNASGTAFRNLN
jgi:hypothetical protein